VTAFTADVRVTQKCTMLGLQVAWPLLYTVALNVCWSWVWIFFHVTFPEPKISR